MRIVSRVSMRPSRLALPAILTLFVSTSAQAEPRTVVELFTSQGCSSCPPADRIMGELAKNPDVIALTMPIDYWDYLGWKDTLADARFTARQKAYSKARGDRDVFTPQMVVNGVSQVIGNDASRVASAVTLGRTTAPALPVTIETQATSLAVTVDAKAGTSGEVWLCAVARETPIAIPRGENRGREIVYHNVVRHFAKLGDFDGTTARFTVPLADVKREGGSDAVAVIVQHVAPQGPGAILGAAMAVLPSAKP